MSKTAEDYNLSRYVEGVAIMTMKLGWTEQQTSNHIIKYYPGSNPNQVRLLTKHFYKYPPVPRQVAA